MKGVVEAYRRGGGGNGNGNGNGVGLMLFDHTSYEKYKCRGPYVENWGMGVAKWHPSRYGHRLRAGPKPS